MKNLCKQLLGGFAISLGCIAYLSCANPIVGAFLFTLGLFLVLERNYWLYTGKVGYIKPTKLIDWGNMVLGFIWNYFGIKAGWFLIFATNKYSLISQKALEITTGLLAQSPVGILFLAILCGIIIYLSVEVYKQSNSPIGKYLGLLLLIPTFIICGFAHSVAVMFYMCCVDLSPELLLYLGIIFGGNAIGAIGMNKLEGLREI